MFLLERDLACLEAHSPTQIWNRSAGRHDWEVPSVMARTYWYWTEWLASERIARVLADTEVKESDLLLLSAIARRVLAIMLQTQNMNVRTPERIAATIEAIQIARFERKVLHLRANPQLLIEVRDEVKAKRKAIRAASEPDKS